MENKKFCQSCSMPIDDIKLQGTEKDGSKSKEYCMYCYQQGAFINPGMSMKEMEVIVKTQMEKMKMDPGIIQKAVSSLPYLKRWQKSKEKAF